MTSRHRSPDRGTSLRCLFALTALVVWLQFGAACGAPGDIFTIPAPVIGSDPPKASDILEGDASVSTQTGALQYRYPIRVPPGRNGIAPPLALTYSSQAPIYGALAAGWSLSIPIITEDTTNGRLWATAVSVPLKNYQSSMAGGRPLIPVSEPTSNVSSISYRAQNDTTFTRYERADPGRGFRWLAFATDGTIYYFGDADHISTCTIVSDEYAPLKRMSDAFGNLVEYFYQAGADGECRISRTTWGQNVGASVSAFASITFGYNDPAPSCSGIPIGSQTSYRTGTKIVTGASELRTITITAFSPGASSEPDHTRLITLTYSSSDANCSTRHAAFRSLSSIQESAWGTDAPRVDLPPVSFTYGDATFLYPPHEQSMLLPWHAPEGGASASSTTASAGVIVSRIKNGRVSRR